MLHDPHRQIDFLEASERAGDLIACAYERHEAVPAIFYGAQYADRIFWATYNYVVLPRE